MEQKAESIRNSRLEFLRILAGMLIVVGHAASKGGGMLGTSGVNNIMAHIFGIGANFGSNTLAAIGFYFLIRSNFKTKSWLRIWCLTLYYYGIVIAAGVWIVDIEITADMLWKLLPVVGRPYWFVTAYLLFLLFIPFLNHLLKGISDGVMKKLLLTATVTLTIIPTIVNNATVQNDLLFFLYLYLLEYWLFYRKEGRALLKRVQNSRLLPVWIGLIFFTMLLWGMVIQRMGGQEVNQSLMMRLSGRESILMIALTLLAFAAALKGRPFYHKGINWISQAALGLYLFHCHPYIKNEYIWRVFHYSEFYDSVYFGLYTLMLPCVFLGIVLILEIPERFIFNWIMKREKVQRILAKIDGWFVLEDGEVKGE